MSSPAPRRTLVLGGTRSGKSGYAEDLLPADTAVRYAATARRLPGDDEWEARIAAHRGRRPATWVTVESPDLVGELSGPGPLLVDDLGTWLTNVLDDASAWTEPTLPPAVTRRAEALVDAVRRTRGRVVLVSAEVGMGVVPETRSGRVFRDQLGALNAALAEACDETVLVIAGLAVPLSPAGGLAAPAPPQTEAPSAGATTPDNGVVAPGAAAAVAAAGSRPVGARPVMPAATTSGPGVATRPAESAPREADPAVLAPADFEPLRPQPVTRPDVAARREAVARISALAVPVGGLGELGELGAWLAACQGECPPRPPVQARVLLVADDHGIAEAGVSAYPSDAGRARAAAALAGTLPVTIAARTAGAAVRTVDVGLSFPVTDGDAGEHVVARGSGRIDRADALTSEQAERAYRTGQRLADEEIDAGADVLVPASLAVGATTPASVLVAALTGAEPVAVIGRGSGIDDNTWMRKAAAVRDALRRAREHLRDPLALLRTVGGSDIVVIAGFLARAADRRVPVVLDGLVVGAAALLAEELAPGAREWWVAAQGSTEPAMTLVLEHLSLTPVLGLGLRTDDGTAGVAVLPLLVTAARLIAETGTAVDTGIVPLGAG
ncbi:bifunctional adenosylcobinamide kinase/adenosylcobinamide-phosphate guanylyltransferase [Pseudonocardia sp. KRD291]|uniref:bifunctional adenosylcobinamide kinase/adenosylcobinamide-phosphate guanylyltransferase n=1 Tax=Pseudonocardia sp. KRD291 TaxID=2792007 RepID=UPI001C5C80AE|nr:bifunctional adenosylcobinamide kinase/adenosylcobinamide-phosphate guanylyltransferase [Pseudonocardia sp. KRD291]MBW0102525.1 bifunctional adenosylcobinamide kinase/adenosylcobinamide-phosphate guanylyltransferase [Pseudonocardia sp. KRD291]